MVHQRRTIAATVLKVMGSSSTLECVVHPSPNHAQLCNYTLHTTHYTIHHTIVDLIEEAAILTTSWLSLLNIDPHHSLA